MYNVYLCILYNGTLTYTHTHASKSVFACTHSGIMVVRVAGGGGGGGAAHRSIVQLG